MRIPSYEKIRLIARAYTNVQPIDGSLFEQANALEKQLHPIALKWATIREAFCNGEPCICASHPEHSYFSEKIGALQNELRYINGLIINNREAIYNKKLKELMIMRRAKMKFSEKCVDTV
jgi:hypothetical protein